MGEVLESPDESDMFRCPLVSGAVGIAAEDVQDLQPIEGGKTAALV